ncbi:ABC transporter substrate-binding protein [Thiosulfativibrio zosterae]|uniref:Peptide ABC transporter substrate-binding protein n=1 Tax=Thiosulfativibrio zosterae TaxID=2675053 RepID=A0A6F8PNC0_9GAMM|nr:ABC transporter substrate-binding protein [Thiosulfativibrio zosterae]BBP43612.1 peptide ABC transporter substrate-binding protein [Thiosulfativibrio zosterae]
MMSASSKLESFVSKSRLSRRAFLKSHALVLSGASLLSTQGCSHEPSGVAQIHMGVTARPRMLDPRQATDALSSRVNRLIYRQLIDFNESFETIPDLATWQLVSPTHYRFTLQMFPQFHHGKPLEAVDVVATYLSILDPSTGSAHRGSLKNIASVEALDQQTIDFKLVEPDALFVGRLVIGILPADLLQASYEFSKHPIGCGECQFVSMTEQRLVLKRSDAHELHFVPVKDATVRVLKLQKGELDIIQNDLSPELVNYCEKHPDLKATWHAGTSFGYVGFNFKDSLLQHLEMRQAIAYGIDRRSVINAMFDGHARLAGGLLVPEHWCGVAGLEGFDFQPEKAKQLIANLKKSGKIPPGLVNSEGFIELSYKTSSDPTRIRLATIYQAQLKSIGILLKIQSYDWGTFYSDIKQGRFQLYSLAWVGVKSPDIFQYVFDSQAVPPKGANRGFYQDALADQLISEATQTQDLAKQQALYRQLQTHLQDTLAVLPLWYEDQFMVARNTLGDVKMFADGRFDGLLSLKNNMGQ